MNERHDCGYWRAEGVGCARCNPIARDIWPTPPDHSIADEMLEELRRERDQYREALEEIARGEGGMVTGAAVIARRALNPTEVDG